MFAYENANEKYHHTSLKMKWIGPLDKSVKFQLALMG